MTGSSASGFRLDEVSGVGVNVETHVTGVVADDGFWIFLMHNLEVYYTYLQFIV